MPDTSTLTDRIFNIQNQEDFNELSLEIFHLQASKNPVYKEYIERLNILPDSISSANNIPFLPIEFFKTRKVLCSGQNSQKTFLSSGTGGLQSKHHIVNTNIYEQCFNQCFARYYGDIKDYGIFALLPSSKESPHSSLVYMADKWVKKSIHPDSGFYLHRMDELADKLSQAEANQQKTILFGVSHALLRFAEKQPCQLRNTIVMETGGMKGKRKELVREELHALLCNNLGVKNIHSEYGMTELLSQAYSKGKGIFHCPPWMKIVIREISDPFEIVKVGKTGGINIIDFANFHSCSFIASNDVGRSYPDGSFEVLGRLDHSEIRGCNLLMA